ncbi:MBL fold metallo-hydrolase [Bacillus sp. FJAT-49736]|uniref:MBL fold metallo-hydrolase n=1 Tax=Bacillus sp. FJAT-49736 TaxID=2833582 RepID=UPI001BC98F97|nr:MBL fold metallo-hydrolase [Bacillus sp. FJAT-49736]MBS4172839.1 MBL fold metallo-hydrolase [Bacillus sp. FJAT-49736]
MKVAQNVEMVELNIQGFHLNLTLLWDEEMAILVDTGMPGQLSSIQAAMENTGVPFEKLKAIILTHQDIDHIGSLPEILQACDWKIDVYAHELDKPYIEGSKHLIKADPDKISKEAWDSFPEPMKALYLNPPKAKVDHVLEDGQVLPYCGGIEVIFTPGHTPGHISLYLQESKTLITGDAMVISNGNLQGPVQRNTPDMETALQSLGKFVDYDIESVICYHGGYSNDNVQEQILKIVQDK